MYYYDDWGLSTTKRSETVIDALALLPQNQFQLWLIGDGELFEEVSKYAAKSPVHENIRFWGKSF